MPFLRATRIVIVTALTPLVITVATATAQTCTFTITPGVSAIPASGGITRVHVTAQPGTCGWNVLVEGGAAAVGRVFKPAAGDGYFEVSMGPTMNPGMRIASLLVIGDGGFSSRVVVSQQGFSGCFYGVTSLPPSPVLVSSNGGGVEVTVTTMNDFLPGQPCPWWATSEAVWMTVTASSTQSNGIVNILVQPNPAPYSRLGAVFIAGVRVYVSQAGIQPIRNIELGGGSGGDPVLYDPASGRFDALALHTTPGGVGTHETIDYYTWGVGKTVAPGDFDANGLTDFLVYDGGTGECQIHITAPGRLSQPAWDCGTGPLNATPTILDFNRDRYSDILLYDSTSGAWQVKITRQVAVLGGAIYEDGPSGVWADGWQIHTGRFNDDTRDDVFLYNANPAHPYGGRWFLGYARDDGTLDMEEGALRWAGGWTVVPGDFDGDGRTEIFLHGHQNRGYWYIVDFRDTGTAYFGGQWAAGWEVYAADFNTDNRTDLFLYQKDPGPYTGLVFRALSDGAYGFDYVPAEMRWAGGWRVSIADLDADGLSDVFLDGRTDGISARVLTRSNGAAWAYTYEFDWPVAARILLSRRITP